MEGSRARARGRPRSFNDSGLGTRIRALDRAVEVLRVVAEGSGMSLTEIATGTGQPAPTVYRILITLQTHGIVEFDEAEQLWHIGVEAYRIGTGFLRRTKIIELSRPVMQHIMLATGETANIAIIDRGEVVFLSQVETHEPIRAFFRPGTRGPIHASGIGKAVLAFQRPERIEALLNAHSFTSFTEKTITDRGTMIEELMRIRDRGWAVDDEERTKGMRCIAAPIFNEYGEAVAGISLSGPSVRVMPDRDEEFGTVVRAAADEITRAAGGLMQRKRA